MRTLILAAVVLASWTCRATVGISVDADLLKNSDGSPMPMTGLVVLVASTTDSTFNAPTAGSFVSGDDIVVAKFNLSGATNGVLIDIASGLHLTGNWNSGDPLAIYWYPTLTTNSTAPTAGIPYGMYTTTSPSEGDAWVTPTDGTPNVDLRMITSDANTDYHLAGTLSPSVGLANLTVGGSLTPPNLAIQLLGGGNVDIHLTGAANANYALQYVSALLNANTSWQTLSNGKADGTGVIDFLDTPGTGPRFYRGQALP